MCYLITGTAGFIGFYLAKSLLEQGQNVIGIDGFIPYYPVLLKEARHKILKEYKNFTEKRFDLSDLSSLEQCFQTYKPKFVCHLAAQAGVRYSIVNPFTYQKSNVEAFLNIMETAKRHKIKRFVYASSSSVYGNVKEVPYHEEQRVDEPVSLYAATKRANELMAYSYTHLYGIQTVGLRFFTVYGPWGRPDMAIWKFTEAILSGEPIQVYNFGNVSRDFTYIDDIVVGILSALHQENLSPYEIINLGNNNPENVMKLISLLEKELGKKAITNFLPMQPGDMLVTYANVDKAKEKLGYTLHTPLEKGLHSFVSWFQEHRELTKEVKKIGCLG